MPPIIGLRTNRKLHFWGPRTPDFWNSDVLNQICPSFLTFDNDLFVFDSSCRVFDHGEDELLTFDSTYYRFDGVSPVMDGN